MKKNFYILIENLVPGWIREKYPNYVNFLSYIFESLETNGGPLELLNNFYKYIDVSNIDDNTLTQYLYQYAHSFPINVAEKMDIKRFIENSKLLYSSKGTENSIKFLFNLYENTLQVYYPHEEIMVLGDDDSKLSGYEFDGPDRAKRIKKLHDNFYYAFYVYEIQTDMDFLIYSELLNELLHPAGCKLFVKRFVFMNNDGIIVNPEAVLNRRYTLYVQREHITKAGWLDEKDSYLSVLNGLIASGPLIGFNEIDDNMKSFYLNYSVTSSEANPMYSTIIYNEKKNLSNFSYYTLQTFNYEDVGNMLNNTWQIFKIQCDVDINWIQR